MRTEILSLELMMPYVGDTSSVKASDNRHLLRKAALVTQAAVETELTEKQQLCVKRHFYDGVSVTSLAEELGVSKSTVSRHLSRAKLRIEKCVRYACFESAGFRDNGKPI